MTSTYKPQPGTTAYRILAWLEAEGKTAERNSSQIAHAMGIETNGVPTLLAPALAAHLVFRRQKDRTHPRAPFWYSLTDHGVRQRLFTSKPAEWMDRPKAQTLVDAHADSAVDGSAETHEQDSTAGPPAIDGAASEGTAVTPGPSQLEAAPDTSEGLASQQVLKAEAARPDATAREARPTGSPGVGPMGAGQPADAGPTTDESAAQQGNFNPVTDAVEPAAPAALPLHEQRREVDEQFAASLRAAMDFGDDDDALARGAELGRREDQLPAADLATTRRAVHAPPEPVPLAFRAARFTDGSLHLERHGQVIASLAAAEVDTLVRLLGPRGT